MGQRRCAKSRGLAVRLANLPVDLLTEDGKFSRRSDAEADDIVLNPGDPDLDVVADHHAFPLASAEYNMLGSLGGNVLLTDQDVFG